MRPYFETMPSFGKELKENRITRTQESRAKLEAVEAEIAALCKARQDVGVPAAEINKRGSLTVWQRIEYLVDKGTFLPLHSLYNPAGQRRRHHQRRQRSRQDRRPLGRHHRLRQQIAGRRLDPRSAGEHPAGDQHRQAPAYPAGVAGPVQRRQNDRPGEVLRRPPRQRHLLLPSRRTGADGDSRSLPASTGPIRPAAATRASARPSCSPTRTPTWRSAGSVSYRACRRKGGFDVAGLEELIAKTRDMRGQAAGPSRDPLRRDRFLHPRV